MPQVSDLRKRGASAACLSLQAPSRRPKGTEKEHEGTQGKAEAALDRQKNTRPPRTTLQTPGHGRVLLDTVILRRQRSGLSVETSAGQEEMPIRNRHLRQARDRQRAPPTAEDPVGRSALGAAMPGRSDDAGLRPPVRAWAWSGSLVGMDERRLDGGFDGGATVVDETVRRMAGPWSPSVHRLLAHLQDRGFDGAPRPLGVDDLGREIVSYLPGQTVGSRSPWPAWTHNDEALVQVAGWLRPFHDAVLDFDPGNEAVWREGGIWSPGM